MWVEDDGGMLVNLWAFETVYVNGQSNPPPANNTFWVEASRDYANADQKGIHLCMVRDEDEGWDLIGAIGQAIALGKPLLSLTDALRGLREGKEQQP